MTRMTTLVLLVAAAACSDSDLDSVTQEGKKPSVDAPPPPPPPDCPKTLSCASIADQPDPNQGWTLYGSHFCDHALNGDSVGYLQCIWTRPSYPWGPITSTTRSISAPAGCTACVQTAGPTGPACATQSNGLPLYLQGDQTWVCGAN
jgi:hypothetical protein